MICIQLWICNYLKISLYISYPMLKLHFYCKTPLCSVITVSEKFGGGLKVNIVKLLLLLESNGWPNSC